MEIQKDFRELLALFNELGVEYLIVGAYALAFHGAPRFTGDIDIFVKPDPQNARRVFTAVRQFGIAIPNLTAADFLNPDTVVQLGVPPVRIDLMTSITGVSWTEADSHKAPGTFGDLPVHFLGREQYVINKRATGRKKDLADMEALGEE